MIALEEIDTITDAADVAVCSETITMDFAYHASIHVVFAPPAARDAQHLRASLPDEPVTASIADEVPIRVVEKTEPCLDHVEALATRFAVDSRRRRKHCLSWYLARAPATPD